MKKGFTLLELIIVVIIIGVLATLGITQYGKAIGNAKNAFAKGTLDEMRKAAMGYYSLNSAWPATTSITADLDGDTINEITFTAPASTDFGFSSQAAGTGKATKTATAGAGVNSWQIDYSSGSITTF